MLFLLAFIASGVRSSHPGLVAHVEAGALNHAAIQTRLAIDSKAAPPPPAVQAQLGRLLGYLMLTLGRDAEAEELLLQQRKFYSAYSRDAMRCSTHLDHAALMLAQHRLGRAAQCASQAIDDPMVSTEQRIEALAILCDCLGSLGEHESRQIAMTEALALAETLPDPVAAWALSALDLRQMVRCLIKPQQGRGAVAMCLSSTDGSDGVSASVDQLMVQIQALSKAVAHHGLLFQGVSQMQSLLWTLQGDDEHSARLLEHIRWLHERDIVGTAECLRVDAALASLSAQNHGSAMRFIQPLVVDETRIGRHRQAVQLHYCMAALHAHAGRHLQAFQALNEHAVAATRLLRAELVRVKLPRGVAERHEARGTCAEALRLPVRYRQAYQFIVENLTSTTLNVAIVAERLQVTPRMLQLTFREHLGITPAELIRRLRLDHIKDELATQPNKASILQVAKRWGISSRSTLSRSLRLPPTDLLGSALEVEGQNQRC